MLKRFFLHCSGADMNILSECSNAEQNKFVGIGATVFFIIVVAKGAFYPKSRPTKFCLRAMITRFLRISFRGVFIILLRISFTNVKNEYYRRS